jgi:hypothetical protein
MGRKEDFVVQYYIIDAMPNTMNLDGGWWLHQYTCCFRPVNSKKSIHCKMTLKSHYLQLLPVHFMLARRLVCENIRTKSSQ